MLPKFILICCKWCGTYSSFLRIMQARCTDSYFSQDSREPGRCQPFSIDKPDFLRIIGKYSVDQPLSIWLLHGVHQTTQKGCYLLMVIVVRPTPSFLILFEYLCWSRKVDLTVLFQRRSDNAFPTEVVFLFRRLKRYDWHMQVKPGLKTSFLFHCSY